MATYLDFPAELFSQLGTNTKLTRAVNFSHACADRYGSFLHFCTMYNGKRYKTTKEQKEQAEKLYKINVKKAVDAVGTNLIFVAMGMDYAQRYDDDVCNHRIRTEIINPEGRKFFIEVGTWGNELTRIDHVIDRDLENEYKEKAQHYRDQIQIRGGFNKIGHAHPLYIELKKYEKQPYYWYKKEVWQGLELKYTKQNVIELVNNLFDCNFNEMAIDYEHLTTDIYSSISPKK